VCGGFGFSIIERVEVEVKGRENILERKTMGKNRREGSQIGTQNRLGGGKKYARRLKGYFNGRGWETRR